MAVDLLSYQGNAGLGLGSNPDIEVGGGGLNVLNNTMRDIMLLNNEKNVRLYNQKIRDRDRLQQEILQGQVSTGEIDPKDQKYFDTAKKGVEDAFKSWGGDQNDTEGFRKYQTAVTNLQDTATHAQTRWVGLKKMQQEISQEKLPSKKADMQKFYDEQESKKFGDQITPYQQLHDFSIDGILGGVNPTKTSTIDPNNPVSYDVATVDYADILKNKTNDYLNNQDERDNIDQFTPNLLNYSPPDLIKAVDAANSRLKLYNAQRGLSEGQPGYAAPIKTAPIKEGSPYITITEPKTDLAAKWALANYKGDYVTRTPKFNKDIVKSQYDKARLGLEAQRNQILAKKAGIEAYKANAYVKKLSAETKKIVDGSQQEGTDIAGEYNSFIDNIKPAAITVSFGGKKTGNLDAIYMDEMPAGTQYINGPIVDSKGKVTAGRLIPFVSSEKKQTVKDPITGKAVAVNAGRPYYIPKYVNPSTGEKLDLGKLPSDIQEGADAAKKQGISKDDYIRILLKKGILELQLQGKNGLANYTSLAQSAKLINNQTTKKGQENVMNPPEAAPNAPEDSQDDTNPENN